MPPTNSPPQTPRFHSTFHASAEEPFLPSPKSSASHAYGRREKRYPKPALLSRYFPTFSSNAFNRLGIISFTLFGCVFLYLLISVLLTAIRANYSNPLSPNQASWDVDVVKFEKEDGTPGWTVHIPKGLTEPLKPNEYRRICEDVEKLQHHHGGQHVGHRSYYWKDPEFIDPAEEMEGSWDSGNICRSSLTYILESNDYVGMGVDLMSLWTSYGLAKKEGRAFFINDRNWAWGKYSSYFLPPSPTCKPPPPNVQLACPHQAKHLVVTPATNTFTFGHAFNDEYEDPRKMGIARRHKIFALARQGYEDLFRLGLRGEDEEIVELRKRELLATVGDGFAAIHVRRGDGRARNQVYHGGYIPLAEYVAVAANISSDSVVVASDDSGIHLFPEFAATIPAQANKVKDLKANKDIQQGFVKDQFLRLQMGPRVEVGRKYLRDLKILGELAGVGDKGGVVCGWNSMTCRVLAVVMGWAKAVEQKRWKNVDGGYGWSGVNW
ncbi:hypothetical protein RUND412_010726 [Rhizina undulata]